MGQAFPSTPLYIAPYTKLEMIRFITLAPLETNYEHYLSHYCYLKAYICMDNQQCNFMFNRWSNAKPNFNPIVPHPYVSDLMLNVNRTPNWSYTWQQFQGNYMNSTYKRNLKVLAQKAGLLKWRG